MNASTVTDYLATLDPARTTALIVAVLVAHGALALLIHYATRHGRARAHEAARAWADIKRVEWQARAQARAARETERATGEARAARTAHRALIAGALGVLLVAIAAMNLSAHGIQAKLGDVGLGALDARISVFIVFEGLLALAGGLSFWHQVSGRPGIDRYAVGMWAVSLIMAYLAAWGGDSPLFGIFPIIAAVAAHELVVAEAKRRGTYRGILGRGATSEDATTVDTERRYSAIVTYGTRANVGLPGTRWAWAIAHARAERAADARGILTPEAREQLKVRAASRYLGARALSPEAVEAFNPWNTSAPTARAARAAAPSRPAPAPQDAPAAPRALRVVEGAALDEDTMRALIADHYAGPQNAYAWTLEFWEREGKLPTGAQLAGEFGGHPGACRKWVSAIKAQAQAAFEAA